MRRNDTELAQHDTPRAQDAQPAAQAVGPPERGAIVGGSHRIEGLVCTTALGPVHRATHVGLGRRVSLLRLRASPGATRGDVERAMRELRAVHVAHPAVIGVRDVIVERDGAIVVVLEDLEGETLGAYVARRGHLDPEHAVTLLAPVLDALGAIHRRGLAHGALTSESIVVGRGRARARLVDLGLARLAARLGAPAILPGPIPCAAPERSIGTPGSIGPWTDVWSMGALLHACLGGKAPYDERADAAAIAQGAVVPIESRVPHAPRSIVIARRRALARDPGHRFASAWELRDALRELELGEGPAPATRSGPRSTLRAARIAGASLIATAAIGAVSLACDALREDAPPPVAAMASVALPRRPAAPGPLRSDCWPDESAGESITGTRRRP